MKQVLVISGKGGTGKTTLVASFAWLVKDEVLLVDCDVDAANLYLIANPEKLFAPTKDFVSKSRFWVDTNWCSGCRRCESVCRFGAIEMVKPDDSNPQWLVAKIDELDCEGCGCCEYVCPAEAIHSEPKVGGKIYFAYTRFGPMVYAQLGPAESNSGKLVTTVRQHSENVAKKENKELVLLDGAPGIGCPVISSIVGVDLAVIVAEPTLSGLHDMERVIKLCKHFGVETKVVINKFNLNEEVSKRIEHRVKEMGAELIGKISFDKRVVEAMSELKTIFEYAPGSEVAEQIKYIWDRVKLYAEN